MQLPSAWLAPGGAEQYWVTGGYRFPSRCLLALGIETQKPTRSVTPTIMQLHFIRKMVRKDLLTKKVLTTFWCDATICLVLKNKIPYEPV